jgi:hypothetical protein
LRDDFFLDPDHAKNCLWRDRGAVLAARKRVLIMVEASGVLCPRCRP